MPWRPQQEPVPHSGCFRGSCRRLAAPGLCLRLQRPEDGGEGTGFAWPDYKPTDQDGENIWVFTTDDKVESWAMVSGYHGDPCFYEGERPPTVVDRPSARFRVEDTGERVLDDVPYRPLRPTR